MYPHSIASYPYQDQVLIHFKTKQLGIFVDNDLLHSEWGLKIVSLSTGELRKIQMRRIDVIEDSSLTNG